MDRKISARISAANGNSKGKGKAMSAVDAFGPREADLFARKMIETESRGNGDQMNAMARVAERCGLTARQLRRFLAGEIKHPGWELVHGIHVGWFSLIGARVNALQHEMHMVKARYGSGDRYEDLISKIEALASEASALDAQLKKRKGEITQ